MSKVILSIGFLIIFGLIFGLGFLLDAQVKTQSSEIQNQIIQLQTNISDFPQLEQDQIVQIQQLQQQSDRTQQQLSEIKQQLVNIQQRDKKRSKITTNEGDKGETIEILKTCLQNYAYEINPYDADVKFCTGSKGDINPTTGKDSISWFVWGGCTNNKYYKVNPGEKLVFQAHTDSCLSCVCYHPNFYVYEYRNDDWVEMKYFDLPDKKGITEIVSYTPNSDKIKIHADQCFYLDVYSLTSVEKEE